MAEETSMATGIFGVDVSAYQPDFDFAKAKSEGYDFTFIKATEGAAWKSSSYAAQMSRAKAANMIRVAYHYQRTDSVDAQVANIESMVDKATPLAIDVELGSGGVDITRSLVTKLRAEGYVVAFVYIPKWYWQGHIGSPSLAGLPPNWASWYPDNVARYGSQGVLLVPESVWSQAFGGLAVAVVQFTSSGRVSNYPNGNIDLNFFRGTAAMFLALLGGASAGTSEEAELSELSDKIVAIHDKVCGNYAVVDERPKLPTDPDDMRGALLSVQQAVANLITTLDGYTAPVINIDLVKLAEEMKKQGMGGASAADVAQAVRAQLNKSTIRVVDGTQAGG